MKDQDFIRGIVVTADQQHSRRHPDEVPRALARLHDLDGFTLGWERTVGDEIQALATEPAAVMRAVTALVRLQGWQLGIGVGAVEAPLPDSTRAARGPAYVAAREAVDRAKTTPVAVAVSGDDTAELEAAVWLYVAVLGRRTPEGWEAADLLAEGQTQAEIAATLGISASAVSQRVARAAVDVADAGANLVVRLLGRALDQSVGASG
ncbi:MAG: sigma factor-like helix-turn-helix DNA-binding protein [Propioniciclava sp.]